MGAPGAADAAKGQEQAVSAFPAGGRLTNIKQTGPGGEAC
jgi:hypothetical protein